MTSNETAPKVARWLARWSLRAVGPVVLVMLLVFVVDYGELRKIAGDLDLRWALAAVAMVQATIFFRTTRWIDLHETFGLRRASVNYQLRLTYATNLATLALPQIVNPLSRLVLLVQDGYPTRRSAAASVVEKFYDFASFVGFGLIGTIYLASEFGALVWWAVAAAIAGLAALVAVYAFRSHLDSLIAAFLPRVPGFRDLAGGESSTGVLHELWSTLRPRIVIRLFVASVVIALTQATMLYFLSRSLGLGLSYVYMVAVWGVIALTMLLPISVNGLGTREAVLIAAFHAVDRSTDEAVALGLLILIASAIGSAPGAIEWLRRAFMPSASNAAPAAASAPASALPARGADSRE